MGISGFVCHISGDGCPFISLTFVSVSVPEDWTLDVCNVTQLNISSRWLALMQINYPTGWNWRQTPGNKRLQKRVSPIQSGSGCVDKAACQKLELTGELFFAVQNRNYISLLQLAPEQKSNSSLVTPMDQERKSTYTNGIKSHSCGMADNFSGTQISSESWAEPSGERKKKACDFMELQQVVMVTAIALHETILWSSKDHSYHTPLTLSPHVSKEDPQCVWGHIYSCDQCLARHAQANSKQAAQDSYGSGQLVVWEYPNIYETSQQRRALYSRGHPESKTWASWWASAEAIDHDRSVM